MLAIRDGTLPRKNLETLAEQIYLQEKWPSHIARVYLKLDESALADVKLVRYILSIIRAENLGVGSAGVAHSELAKIFAQFTGISERRLTRATPNAQNRALMDWCDMSEMDRPWIEAMAVHLACESQVRAMSVIRKGLRRHYGASEAQVVFWKVHAGQVERRHAKEGLSLLTSHTPREKQPDVVYAYRMTCRLLKDFYDSILGEDK